MSVDNELNETTNNVFSKNEHNFNAGFFLNYNKRTNNMAYFEGSLKEFNYFLGPIARNVIQQITKGAKKGKCCEKCHRSDVELQAAHVHGEERVQIIESLLNQYYKTSDDSYRVDLKEFVDKFKQYHLPIENHFLFLCEPCHKKYDCEETDVSLLKVQNYISKLSPIEKEKLLKELNLKEI